MACRDLALLASAAKQQEAADAAGGTLTMPPTVNRDSRANDAASAGYESAAEKEKGDSHMIDTAKDENGDVEGAGPSSDGSAHNASGKDDGQLRLTYTALIALAIDSERNRLAALPAIYAFFEQHPGQRTHCRRGTAHPRLPNLSASFFRCLFSLQRLFMVLTHIFFVLLSLIPAGAAHIVTRRNWRHSIRHLLSRNGCFLKIRHNGAPAGNREKYCLWAVHEGRVPVATRRVLAAARVARGVSATVGSDGPLAALSTGEAEKDASLRWAASVAAPTSAAAVMSSGTTVAAAMAQCDPRWSSAVLEAMARHAHAPIPAPPLAATPQHTAAPAAWQSAATMSALFAHMASVSGASSISSQWATLPDAAQVNWLQAASGAGQPDKGYLPPTPPPSAPPGGTSETASPAVGNSSNAGCSSRASNGPTDGRSSAAVSLQPQQLTQQQHQQLAQMALAQARAQLQTQLQHAHAQNSQNALDALHQQQHVATSAVAAHQPSQMPAAQQLKAQLARYYAHTQPSALTMPPWAPRGAETAAQMAAAPWAAWGMLAQPPPGAL